MAADAGTCKGFIVIDDFYRAFEERYYAPREVIKSLRRQYLPFVVPLASFYPGGKTYDLGCGRGEWLELMAEEGLSPFGVDLDAGMLQACLELGLPAIQGDAVAYLRTLESESYAIVTAFHVVEHISFEQLRQVVSEALRVLLPGGLLILETPNPENLSVATHNFYQDPTHQKPIPPTLLSFVVEHSGFSKVKTLRLQESQDLRDESCSVGLLDVIRGVSPDYAVIAQKSAAPGVMTQFDEVFAAEYGLSLEQLAGRYDRRAQELHAQQDVAIQRCAERIGQIEQALERAQQQALEQAQQQAVEQVEQVEQQMLEQMLQQTTTMLEQARAELARTKATLEAVCNSRSWRLTAPLRRWSGRFIRLRSAWKQGGFKALLWHGSVYVNRRPALRRIVLACLNCVPGLKWRLTRVVASASAQAAENTSISPTEPSQLSPHAQDIYIQFKLVSDNRKEVSQ